MPLGQQPPGSHRVTVAHLEGRIVRVSLPERRPQPAPEPGRVRHRRQPRCRAGGRCRCVQNAQGVHGGHGRPARPSGHNPWGRSR